MRKKRNLVLFTVCIFMLLSVITIYSASFSYANKDFKNSSDPLAKYEKPSDVPIPSDWKEQIKKLIDEDSVTPGEDNIKEGDEYYDSPSGLRKVTFNVMKIRSGKDSEIKGLRNPLKELAGKGYIEDLLKDPANKLFKSAIIGINDDISANKTITIYLEKMSDEVAIRSRLLKGLTSEEINKLPDNLFTFKLTESKATIEDLTGAYNTIYNARDNGEYLGDGGFYTDENAGKIILESSTDINSIQKSLKKFSNLNRLNSSNFIELVKVSSGSVPMPIIPELSLQEEQTNNTANKQTDSTATNFENWAKTSVLKEVPLSDG